FARALVLRDKRPLQKIIVASGHVYARIFLLSVLPGIALIPVMTRVIHVSPINVPDLRDAWLIALAVAPLSLLHPLTVLVQANQRGYVINGLLIARWVVLTALSLGLAWAGWGIMGQSAAMSLSSIFFSLSVAAVCYASFPGLLSLRLFREPVDNEVRRDISRLRGPSFLLNLCS